MLRGPKGERRPADVIGNAVHVMRIATGEIEDAKATLRTENRQKGGLKGGKVPPRRLDEDHANARSDRFPGHERNTRDPRFD